MNGQGNKPCGRTVLGPFSWGHMGVNTDLNPKNKTAWGAIWLRTSAAKISTTFASLGAQQQNDLLLSVSTADGGSALLQPPPSPPPSVMVEVISEDLSVQSVSPCTTAGPALKEGHHNATYANVLRTVVVVCEVGNAGIEKHLGLRFSAAKQFREHDHTEAGSGLLSTSFS